MVNVKHALWLVLGFFFLFLGLIGLVLPVFPAIPFLVLASACIFRGSKKTHKKLSYAVSGNRVYIRYFRKHFATKRNTLIVRVGFITVSWAYALLLIMFVFNNPYSRMTAIIVAISATIYINTVKYLDL
ncbi:YbaN family protein [Patescibacteria group bacterium]|nr:YbaN family protein [Patescibacteria group bacterium]